MSELLVLLVTSSLYRMSSPHLRCRQGTPVFIARAIQEGCALPLPHLGLIALPVPASPEVYSRYHPGRIKTFPVADDLVIRKPSPDSVNRPWRHELDHDAESLLWLLLYWLVGAQPADRNKEPIVAGTWTALTGPVSQRSNFLAGLASEALLPDVAHSTYKPVLPLLRDLAAILLVDRHWLDKSETRNDPEYVPEAFQRLILQFILKNSDKKFMKEPVALQFRPVEVTGQNPGLQSTETSRWDAENRKRPSPQPLIQSRVKRPRLAKEVTKVVMQNYCSFLPD
jgi:hypothetical protein